MVQYSKGEVKQVKSELYSACKLCARECKADRNSGKTGFCGADNRIKVARCALHFWEEPCISGEKGSGTVFFSHCTLKCVYCQNYNISTKNQGRYVTEEELSYMFLGLQNQGALNINLVTPTHYVPGIIEALKSAKQKGLTLPVLYNTSGFESTETLELLRGYVDIFLPDFKYFTAEYAQKYSGSKDYPDVVKKAIAKMFDLVGKCEFDEDGIIKKGVIVRHLMLPELHDDSKKILEYLYKTYGDDIFISIMSQYTPLPTLPKEFPELATKIDMTVYDKVLDFAVSIGIENAFVQEGEAASESFIPEFWSE